MGDLELTGNAIDSLISGVVTAAVLGAVLVSGPSGQLAASALGLALLAVGAWRLYEVWNDRDERPVMWFLLLAFGAVFEFGAATDIVTILPFCIVIDLGIIVVSAVVAAFEPVASRLSVFLGQ